MQAIGFGAHQAIAERCSDAQAANRERASNVEE
jgi:hypothetical protein